MVRDNRPTAVRGALFVVLLALTAWAAHAGRIGEAERAADAALLPAPIPVQTPRVEVAFVLDSTGSMSGLIEGAKQKIWSIANQLASGTPTPEVRMALIAYRDRGDEYVTRARDLTADIDAVYADLQQVSAGGGGDPPESVNQALHEAVDSLTWSEDDGVYRVIFLVGDAPPHLDYGDDVPFGYSVRLARQRGIVVNTVQCGGMGGTKEVWQEIASLGGGHYAAIRQDGGMFAMDTPMDEELASLGRALSETLIPYGDAAERGELEAKRDRAAAAAPATVASRLGFLSKLGGRLNAGRADLVDAITTGIASLDEVPEAELPTEVRALDASAREAFVNEKAEQRARLQTRIDALSKQRDAYVSAETTRRAASGEGDGFDAKVLESVREQAASAGIAY